VTTAVQRYEESPFEEIRQVSNEGEFWSARDLQPLLGYVEWRRFGDAIERAMITAQNSGTAGPDQFVSAANMIGTGKGAHRAVDDFHLSRYACYLVAMNGDPRKPEVAAAQTYFAVKTREAEIVQAQIPQTYAEALRAAAEAVEAKELAETMRRESDARVVQLVPRAVAAEAAESERDGQLVWDLRTAILQLLNLDSETKVMEAVKYLGCFSKSGTSKYYVRPEWSDILFATSGTRFISGKEHAYENGPVRIRPGKQTEFLDRLNQAYQRRLFSN
jgi:hypothetical protein